MAMDEAHFLSRENDQTRVLFGPFELDLASGELRKNGTRLRLQKQPFQILTMLLERPGQSIRRQEFCERIWGDDVHVDFEHSLATAIKRLRDTLCDSTSKPRYIETVGRGAAVTGYRFIAPVQGVTERRSAPLKLAVLPFSSLGFKADDYFLDGLTEELNARLGALIPSRLAVIARSSVIASVRGGTTSQDIGKRLKADYLLEGAVRSDRSKCRITVQLVKVDDQNHRVVSYVRARAGEAEGLAGARVGGGETDCESAGLAAVSRRARPPR
jgi:DNA-binding winged helix-turn-helix (wHTH) protein